MFLNQVLSELPAALWQLSWFWSLVVLKLISNVKRKIKLDVKIIKSSNGQNFEAPWQLTWVT